MKITEFTEKKIAYHVTPRKNVSNILSNGLIPSNTGDNYYKEKRIYLFPTRDAVDDAMQDWLGQRFSGEDDMLSLLAVDVTGLDIKNDFDEWYTLDPISKDKIKLVDEFLG